MQPFISIFVAIQLKKPAMRLPLLIILVCINGVLYCQEIIAPEVRLGDTSQWHLLTTQRGDRFIGNAFYVQPPELGFRLGSGDTLFFDLSAVKSVSIATEENTRPANKPFQVGREALYQDLFISNSAFCAPKGTRQFRNTQLAWNHVDFAATSHYSIGMGYVLPFFLIVRTRLASSTEGPFNIGAGINFLFSLSPEPDFPRTAHFYVATTLGRRDKYFNLNAGYALGLKFNSNSQFVITGGGAFRLSGPWSVLIDNLYLPDAPNRKLYPGLGLSYARGNSRLDLGYFFFTTFSTDIVNSPGIGYSRNF